MVLTSDVPLVTGKMIDDFIIKCQNTSFLYYPYFKRNYPEKISQYNSYPYASLKEGAKGNMVILSSSLFNQNKSLKVEFQFFKNVKMSKICYLVRCKIYCKIFI